MTLVHGDISHVAREFKVTKQYVLLLLKGERRPKKGKGPKILAALSQLGEKRQEIIATNINS